MKETPVVKELCSSTSDSSGVELPQNFGNSDRYEGALLLSFKGFPLLNSKAFYESMENRFRC